MTADEAILAQRLERTPGVLMMAPIRLDLNAPVNAPPEAVLGLVTDHERLPDQTPYDKDIPLHRSRLHHFIFIAADQQTRIGKPVAQPI